MPISYMDSQATYVDRDSMIGNKAVTVLTAATATYTNEDSGRVVICTASSGTQTLTIPAATNTGFEITVICGHASGEILINSGSASDTFTIKASEGGASVVTAAGTGVKNTAATNVVGDSITLVANGVTGYYGIRQSGIWATQ